MSGANLGEISGASIQTAAWQNGREADFHHGLRLPEGRTSERAAKKAPPKRGLNRLLTGEGVSHRLMSITKELSMGSRCGRGLPASALA